MLKSLPTLAAILLLASTQATAQTPAPTKAPPALVFLSPDLLKPQMVLPAPYAEGSPQALAELAEVRAIVAAASPERHAQAEADNENESAAVFADVLPGFDIAKFPATQKLFDEVRNDEDAEAKTFKTYFARRRPYQADPTIATCVEDSKRPTSYPSGHATMGYSMAIVLANLVPTKADVIMARARLYAENRLVCGVHFRSDIVAGQVLGTLVAEQLLQDPRFHQDFTAAQAELTAAGIQ